MDKHKVWDDLRRRLARDDMPYTSNYHALHDWLEKIEARCLTQDLVGDDAFEKWAANGRVFLIEVRARKHGFEVWTAGDSNLTEEYLADAARRIGFVPATSAVEGSVEVPHATELRDLLVDGNRAALRGDEGEASECLNLIARTLLGIDDLDALSRGA